MKRRTFLSAIFLATICLQSQPAVAQQITRYDDPSAFHLAAVNELTAVDFEELIDETYTPSISYPGITLRAPDDHDQALWVISPDLFPDIPALQSRVVLSNRNFNPLTLELSPAITAVGLEVLALLSGDGVVVTVEGSEGVQSFDVPLTDGGPTFIGFIAGKGTINRVTVANRDGGGSFIAVDNVRFGNIPVADPLTDGLDALAAALEEGRADGSIRGLGRSLEGKLAAARAAVDAGKFESAAGSLRSLHAQTAAQRGKKIAHSRADQLQALITDLLALIP